MNTTRQTYPRFEVWKRTDYYYMKAWGSQSTNEPIKSASVVDTAIIAAESASKNIPHDEFAIVMDGEVTFNFVKLEADQVPSHAGGAAQLGAKPNGPTMGKVTARRGHQVLLPQGAAYQMTSAKPSVAIIQTCDGPVTVKRWSEICTLGDA